jgi:phosphoglycerate dehydrogenase-like enzyme
MLWRSRNQHPQMDSMSSPDSAETVAKPRVGCIGLGRLGWQLAAHLLASGFTVSG